jgi:surface protein
LDGIGYSVTIVTEPEIIFANGFEGLCETCGSTGDFVTTWKTDNPGISNESTIAVPMVGGPYKVDWNNDGIFDQSDLYGSVVHEFPKAGEYKIRISGNYDAIRFESESDRLKLVSLDQWGTNQWKSMASAFYLAENLQIAATDTPNFSAVTDMRLMFFGAPLANPITTSWDTSSVTSMALMFYAASNARPDTSGWDTSAVTSMRGMFAYSAANPDTSAWDTSSVTSMADMFYSASNARPDTSGWDTSSVTNVERMFAVSGAAPDTSGWDTSSIINMSFMFSENWTANPDTSGWNTSSVTDMSYMFHQALNANPNMSNWDVTSLLDATGMFMGVKLSTDNYEGLLVGWGSQELQPNVFFDGGQSTYCSDESATARANMVENDLWSISDGGLECP